MIQTTHRVLFKSRRDVLQINALSQQLGLGSQLKEWYQDEATIPYSHLLIDLTPKTVDSLKYCTNSTSVPSKFFLSAGTETKFLDDEHTIRLYTTNISKTYPKIFKNSSSSIVQKSFIHFLSQCLVNLLRGQLRDLRKIYVVNYRREISELTRRRTSLHKRRTILSSPKGLELIYLITSFVIKRLTQYGSVCFKSLLSFSITKYALYIKKKKIRTKSKKRTRLYQRVLNLFAVL